MFEYHGWARIADATGWEDDGPSDPRIRRSSDLIWERVEEQPGYALLRLDMLNGGLFLHLAGMPNHRGTHGDRILQLFRDVAMIAPGSYGLLCGSWASRWMRQRRPMGAGYGDRHNVVVSAWRHSGIGVMKVQDLVQDDLLHAAHGSHSRFPRTTTAMTQGDR